MNLPSSVRESLKELIALAGDEIREIEVEKRFLGWKVRISKGGVGTVVQSVAASPAPAAAAPAAESAQSTASDSAASSDDGPSVTSPMVGTFYRSPSPDADPFVKEGDVISVGQTVCIIEAMKIMNEIESEVSGRVTKILVENGSPVEYNTPLFLVDPA